MLGWTIRPRLAGDVVSPEYLERMALDGWQLKILGRCFLYFKSASPKKISYAVDVMGKERASIEHSMQSRRVQEYIAMCQEFGWEFVDSDGVFFVFSAKQGDAISLQTDEEAYRNSVQYIRRIRMLRRMVGAALVVLGMFIFMVLTGWHSVLLSIQYMAIFGILGVDFVWSLLMVMVRGWIIRRAEKILTSGVVPRELDDRKLAWIEVAVSMLLLLTLVGVWCHFQKMPVVLPLALTLVISVIWSVGRDMLYHVCWRYMQTTRIATIVLVGLTMFVLNSGMESLTGYPAWVQAGMPETSNWQPFVTEQDLGWPEADLAEGTWVGTQHAVQYSYSASSGNYFTYDLFYSPYDFVVESFCKTAQRYYLPGPGMVEVTNQKEYTVEAVSDMEVSGWDAFWDHYLFCANGWALHVMTEDPLTQEQIEIIASQMNEFVLEYE